MAYVPSTTVYGRLADASPSRSGKGVLAIGDPEYGDASGAESRERGGVRLVRLPATRDEAIAVDEVVLLGEQATEEGFARAVAERPRWSAVHFACHGLVSDDPCSFCLALTASATEDGYLTALEITAGRIGADLVTLSACDTGRGKVVPGEGLLGLTSAFFLAGAPRIVASLWKVDDEATSELLSAFYARWKSGAPAARALREAQEVVRKDPRWTHPRYWAA